MWWWNANDFFQVYLLSELSEPSNDREVELREYTPLFATLSSYF